ncbi:unnamed protein product [Acanthoscelides obtectus]|uniref:DRBM domain-containing protein n=1 Tax=Acanthoscelides obtectus TaxID=200917 RepID=A0A9P0LN01_ACAOB|nr:unnamed protein product [Acanthoscelides obtectus]CAK1630216.1 Double-stranded RNA-binding protein Staufen homolog 2 [Acanthoscelides obtectus]
MISSLASIEQNVELGGFKKEDNIYRFVDSSITDLKKHKNQTSASVLSQLHELAAYNDLQYQYVLDKEEGPAHAKLFTVTLTVGEEKYTGQGTNLKKAQQSAASQAITETAYAKPPLKEGPPPDSSLTPVALLNDLSTKLGIPIKFSLMNDDQEPAAKKARGKKTYFKKLNDSILDDEELHIRKDLPETSGPFHVKLEVGQDNVFYAVAQSIKVAKHEAAISALEFFIENKDKMDLHCLKEGSEEQCRQNRQKLKSPISIIYEAGQARKIGVEFNIISETGKNHRKTFVTECIFGDSRAIGEGSSKKESKKAAAENMLEIIKTLDPLPLGTQLKSLTAEPKKKKKGRKNKVIKTNFEKIRNEAEQLFDSFISNFGKNRDVEDTKTGNQNRNDHKKETRHKPKPGSSYQTKMLKLSNFLNTEIQFMDLKDGKYSLLAIHLDPEYLCLGHEQNDMSAKENAALHGLQLLKKMGMMEHFEGETDLTFEREIKNQVDDIMKTNIEEDS